MTTRYLAILAILPALLCSCITDDTDFSELIDNQDPYRPDLTFDYSPLQEQEETIEADNNDYYENWKTECDVYITFNGDNAVISGDTGDCSITSDGAHVTASLGNKNMNFHLSGNSSDGSFKLYGDKRFMVTLGNLRLTNPAGAAINSQCGKSMYLMAAADCQATLSDGSDYIIAGQEDMKGCVFSEGQIILAGTGRIDIESLGKNALVSDDYVMVRPGILLNIKSAGGNGIKGKDGVMINGGRINIEVSENGSKGINSEADLEIRGGRTIIICKGDLRVEPDRTVSAAAVKCDFSFIMTGVTLLTQSTGEGGKGINSDVDVSLSGGEVFLSTFGKSDAATPRALKAGGRLDISDTNVIAYSKNCSPVSATGGIDIADGYSDMEETPHLFSVTFQP